MAAESGGRLRLLRRAVTCRSGGHMTWWQAVTGCQALVMTTSLLSSQPRSTVIAPSSQQLYVCINRGVTCERRDLHGVNLCNIFVTRFLTPAKRQQKLAFKTIKRLRKNADVVQMRSKRMRTRSTVSFKCVTEAIRVCFCKPTDHISLIIWTKSHTC